MMTGAVNSRLEAELLVSAEDSAGHLYETDAVIDTGFTADFTLPPAVIARLGLTWRSSEQFILANGSSEWIDRYDAIVMWDYAPCSVIIDAVDVKPLSGTNLLRGFDVRIQFKDGGSVTVEALP